MCPPRFINLRPLGVQIQSSSPAPSAAGKEVRSRLHRVGSRTKPVYVQAANGAGGSKNGLTFVEALVSAYRTGGLAALYRGATARVSLTPPTW